MLQKVKFMMVKHLEHESMPKKRLDTKYCIVSSTLQNKIYTFEIYLLFSYKSIAWKHVILKELLRHLSEDLSWEK